MLIMFLEEVNIMKSYVVLGLGRFGRNFAQTLVELGHNVLAVDRNEQLVQEFSETVTHVMTAECSSEDFLKSIGIKNFDAVIVAIGDDIQSSILTTLILKELGANFILAKAQNNLHAKVLMKVGADRVIQPERDMAVRAANNLVSNNIIDMIELSPDYSIMETEAPSDWIGKTIRELNIRAKYGISIMAIKNNGGTTIAPTADIGLDRGDIIAVIGKNSDLNKLKLGT
jgi:trk system potassium uptake protein TrkA